MSNDPSAPQLDRIGVFDAEEIAGAIRRGDALATLPLPLQDSVGVLVAVEHQIVEPAYGRPLNDLERLALLGVLMALPNDNRPITPDELFDRLEAAAPNMRFRRPT